MYASKLTLSDEFKKRANTKLSTIRKGELRWEMLEQADKDGRLQLCSYKAQVGKLAGINDSKNAYTWVFNMIQKGAITETFRGFQDGRALYEYHLGVKPSFLYKGGRRKTVINKSETYAELKQRMETPTSQPEEIKVDVSKVTETLDATIKINEAISVVLSMVPVDTLMRIVKKIMTEEV